MSYTEHWLLNTEMPLKPQERTARLKLPKRSFLAGAVRAPLVDSWSCRNPTREKTVSGTTLETKKPPRKLLLPSDKENQSLNSSPPLSSKNISSNNKRPSKHTHNPKLNPTTKMPCAVRFSLNVSRRLLLLLLMILQVMALKLVKWHP